MRNEWGAAIVDCALFTFFTLFTLRKKQSAHFGLIFVLPRFFVTSRCSKSLDGSTHPVFLRTGICVSPAANAELRRLIGECLNSGENRSLSVDGTFKPRLGLLGQARRFWPDFRFAAIFCNV